MPLLVTTSTTPGVEYSAALCREARRNLAKCHIAGEVIHADAADVRYPQDNIFAFFFNPFHGPIVNLVLEKLRAATEGRALVIAWVGPGSEVVAGNPWLKPISPGVFRKVT